MKIQHTFTLVIMIALTSIGCKSDQRKVTSDLLNFPQSANGEIDGPQPKITFEKEEYDFGTIAIGEKVSYSYNFKNTGDAPLLIADVKPSCGCTSLKDWPKDPIAPGESGKITIEFNSSGFPGAISKTIAVNSNAIPKSTYLKLKGQVNGVAVQEEVKPGIDMQRTQ